MLKSAIVLYLVCFSLYLPFSRRPDFWDGEKVPAVVSADNNNWVATYGVGDTTFTVDATYPFRTNRPGDKVWVIYDPAFPAKAQVYKFWGYWLTIGEVLFSIGLSLILSLAAHFITGKNQPPPVTSYYKRRKYEN